MTPLEKTAAAWSRFRIFELELCRKATRAQRRDAVLRLIRVVSRLGDGPAWYGLALLLPLAFGLEALSTVARMTVVGVTATLVSAGLKRLTARPRPFLAHAGILAGAKPLDRYSFPSGHTLHAVAFSIVVVASYGALALVLVPFTLLVAASRVVLGLHYPTDVAAGATVGATLALFVLALF